MTLLEPRRRHLHQPGYRLTPTDLPLSHRSTSLFLRLPGLAGGVPLANAGSCRLSADVVGTLNSLPRRKPITMVLLSDRALAQGPFMHQNPSGRLRLFPMDLRPGLLVREEPCQLVLSRLQRRRVHGQAHRPDWSLVWLFRHRHQGLHPLVRGHRVSRVWIGQTSLSYPSQLVGPGQ